MKLMKRAIAGVVMTAGVLVAGAGVASAGEVSDHIAVAPAVQRDLIEVGALVGIADLVIIGQITVSLPILDDLIPDADDIVNVGR